MSRNRGRYEESGVEKDKETEENKMPRHEKHPPFRWVSIWVFFYCRTGDFLRFLTQAYPPGGVIYIYIYACWRVSSRTTLGGCRELIPLPPEFPYHLLRGPFRTIQIWFLKDFCVKIWSQLVFWGFQPLLN